MERRQGGASHRLSEDAVTAFYRTLAESPRTIIWMAGCLSRYTNGLQSIRAIIALQALRDNLIGSGRGLLTMEGGKPEGEKEFVDAVCGPAKDSGVNFRRLLNTMKKGNLDVLFLNSSYRRYPDCTGVAEAIKKVGFVVHRGFFKTEEMDVADLFVPPPSARKARVRITEPRSRWSGATSAWTRPEAVSPTGSFTATSGASWPRRSIPISPDPKN